MNGETVLIDWFTFQYGATSTALFSVFVSTWITFTFQYGATSTNFYR